MRTTIKDIAKYTGFSITTISLVLNGKAHKIPKATEEAILQAAKELNYRPNQLAVGLVKKQTKTLGLILSDIRNNFFANMAKSIEDECRRNGWNLILCNTNDLHEREMKYLQMLADKGVDGVLICMARENDSEKVEEMVALMDSLNIPFVLVDRFYPEVKGCSVIVDHDEGGYLAARHLLELGHTRIGCVGGPKDLADSNRRTQGYIRALMEKGVEFDPSLIFYGDYDLSSGVRGAEYLLKKDVTAIFAYNDMSAYGVFHYLKQQGISVPEDISLIGYDDILFSEILSVPLTSIHQPVEEMGTEAVQQMIRIIRQKQKQDTKKNIMFQPYLVVRQSTAAPAGVMHI